MKDTGTQRKCNENTELNAKVNINPIVMYNSNSSINYFIPGPGEEADSRVSAWITKQLQSKFKDVLLELDALKVHFHCRLDLMARNIEHHQGMWHMHCRNHSRKNKSDFSS